MKTKMPKRLAAILGILAVFTAIYGCTRTWNASPDTVARFDATHTAFVAMALTQGTPQPFVTAPTIDSIFYLTRVAVDTQNAPTEIASFQAYHAQVLTAVAQGTPTTYFLSPTVDLLARLQQTAMVETAVAQGTSASSFPTSTPIPTYTPNPTPTLVSIPSLPTNWYSNPITAPLLISIKSLGGEDLVNKLVIATLSILGTALLFSFKSIMKSIYHLIASIWSLSRRLNKNYIFESVYLDWLIGQYRHLGLLPAQVVVGRWGDRQQFVNLEQIYVRLSLSSQADDEIWNNEDASSSRWGKRQITIVRSIRSLLIQISSLRIPFTSNRSFSVPGLAEFTEKYFPETPYMPGALSLAIDRTPRLVVKGDPGSGKTTLLRYLAVTCARALRNDKQEGDSKHLVWDRLSWRTKPFPLVVRLSRHSDVVNWGDGKSLIDAFKDELPIDLRRRCPDGFFEYLLEKRSCLILLDAFDELGTPQARSAMAEYINGFLEVHEKVKHRFLVTTRIVGYEGQLNSMGFLARAVQPLQEGERKALIRNRYKAISLVEKFGRTPAEARAIDIHLQEREQALVERLDTLPRLAQLATNPMLLSLITLVHFLKVELPDERVLLYRDCVEILTERWQKYKREEMNYRYTADDSLTLRKKITLLHELAYAMQQMRASNTSQALLPKKIAVEVIARALSNSSNNKSEQEDAYRRAEDWVKGIQTDSGILIEQGLDHAGEPLIGFSHLTFQEYLAAVAVKENPSYYSVLLENLLNPAWREVVRLYAAQTDNATPIVRALLNNSEQPAGLLLAGWCLTERVQNLDLRLQREIVDQLKKAFLVESDNLNELGAIMENALSIPDIIPFLQEQVVSTSNVTTEVVAIHALRGVSNSYPGIDQIRSLLVGLIDMEIALEARIAATETLSKIGDPRFTNTEPVVVQIPSLAITESDLRSFSELIKLFLISLFAKNTSKNQNVFTKIERSIHTYLRRFINGSGNFVDEFEISRYPITNLEYSRFVYDTGRHYPETWIEGVCPVELNHHPVTRISKLDAVAYCKWLSQKNHGKYRLPNEWEWEIAAGSLDGFDYPWGDEFDPSKCNTSESKIHGTTPVGIYFDVKSKFGVQDTSGNVREMIGYSDPLFNFLLATLSTIGFGFVLFRIVGILINQLLIPFVFAASLVFVCLLIVFIWFFIFIYAISRFAAITKGGSWATSQVWAAITCRYLGEDAFAASPSGDLGFRMVRQK